MGKPRSVRSRKTDTHNRGHSSQYESETEDSEVNTLYTTDDETCHSGSDQVYEATHDLSNIETEEEETIILRPKSKLSKRPSPRKPGSPRRSSTYRRQNDLEKKSEPQNQGDTGVYDIIKVAIQDMTDITSASECDETDDEVFSDACSDIHVDTNSIDTDVITQSKRSKSKIGFSNAKLPSFTGKEKWEVWINRFKAVAHKIRVKLLGQAFQAPARYRQQQGQAKMRHKNKHLRSNATPNDLVDVGARAYGYQDDGTSLRVGGVKAKGGFEDSDYGIGVRGKAGVHVLKYKDFKNKIAVKAFAASVKASAGIDLEALTEKDKIIGYELKAKGTLVEGTAGPIFIHVGAGFTTGSKVSDATLNAKLAGNGIQIGKRIGVTSFDNEISIETLSLVGKGWLWGQYD
ncbi:unnamed protein product [Mytilus coruscus]|uniref:Uncharacterized protein n=1 Tax=Mytilus coruscus TaxID=42192 RepID=A0A6J8EGU6_MYTCO|nr:unnamed protein product [Mytilus coruscus]